MFWAACAVANSRQFVDPLMLMRVVKKEADRRIQFLIADKSMKRRFVGAMAGLTGVVPVGRAMDMTKPATGKIYLPDPISDPCMLRGVGTNFEHKPEVTRRLHRGWPAVIARGSATVQPATSIAARVLAQIFALPTTVGELPLEVIIESRNGREYWTRRFGKQTMRSVMRADGDLLEERFGLVAIAMKLVATDAGLNMHPVSGRFAGIPLPRILLPVVKAEETSEAGRHVFEVIIGLPIIGHLVAYRGSLEV